SFVVYNGECPCESANSPGAGQPGLEVDMADRTCSRDYCDNPVFARTLCTSCYRFYSESGLLDLVAPLRYERHYLSNIDEDARVGDCSVCGPGAKLKRRTGTGSHRWKWQCKTVSKRNKGR